MTGPTAQNGWERLPGGCDLELRHGIPVRVSRLEKAAEITAAELAGEITALTGLRVRIEDWMPGEDAGELQARVRVDGSQFTTVLENLALSAARVFFDRYHKPIDRDDIDWDTLEYANDFRRALEYCGLDWQEVDREACKAGYLEAMHAETSRLAAAADAPSVEPESD